ncbi:MAG: M1 family metallopeptidase [Bacteroidia bacterium]|nr:M1 family metallopeptidase [Bacteroidia bacterium]
MNKFHLWFAITTVFLTACKVPEQRSQKSQLPNNSKNRAVDDNYRPSYTKLFYLINTRLDLKPDWTGREMEGRATLRLRPYFFPTDSLFLDARGMKLHSLELEQGEGTIPLDYKYENNKIRIKLDKIYSSRDSLTISIEYTSRPELLPEGGSDAIHKDKGLYFINADGSDPYKPKQLWTQGETESNSVWFPTIEDPGQRMTQEIYLTVDSALKTVSNGLLLTSINNPDGSRTDYWRQTLPTAPYLTMIAVSDFAIVKKRWREIEVSYYLDKAYEKYAENIFGETTEMLEYFSSLLQFDYPWEKYSQVVVHDFVSGAMENNTAVIHGSNMLQDPRDQHDYNYNDYISHELFHHWFGNLVTCESWANMTLNEGFATYGEYLWREYKYGRDDADYLGQEDLRMYLRTAKKNDAPLIRFNYDEREDVYDAISYQKGGRVLHMLRKLIGDEAFFRAIRNYLKEYQYSAVEFHQLRLEFEKVSGQDLNWFFDQWYLKTGKPSLEIFTSWNEGEKQVKINLKQTQDLTKNPLYRLPIDIDFYFDDKTARKRIVLDSLSQDFVFAFSSQPKLVNVDAEKMLLLEKKKENKNNSEWIYQFKNAPLYLDRLEALRTLGKSYQANSPEGEIVLLALEDKHWDIRTTALENIKEFAVNAPEQVKERLQHIARNDSNSLVRVMALDALGKYYPYSTLSNFYEGFIPDNSYLVEATAFSIISTKDSGLAFKLAEKLESDSGSAVMVELSSFYSENTYKNKLDFFKRALRTNDDWAKYTIINNFGTHLKYQIIPVIREGADLLYKTGLHSNSKYNKNNCIAALISIQNELQSRIKLINKSHGEESSDKSVAKGVSDKQLDIIQIEGLISDIEINIGILEKGSS